MDNWICWEKVIFVAGLMAMLGEGHFCCGIDDYVERRAFLWRDWWLRWQKGIFGGGISGYVGKRAF
jgi:hypothetical protein